MCIRDSPGTRSETHLVVKPEVSTKYGEILPWFLYYLSDVGYWVFALNLVVALFNLLPFKPLDGGIIFEELLGYKLSKEWVDRIVSSVTMVMISIVAFLIIYSIVPGIIQMVA